MATGVVSLRGIFFPLSATRYRDLLVAEVCTHKIYGTFNVA